VLIKYAPRLKIGTIENEVAQVNIPVPGDLSAVPYAEPSYWMGFKSPYFKYVFSIVSFSKKEKTQLTVKSFL
jgi:hypothetical protein